jgi:carboxyl-terminal processing protease
MYRNSPRAIFLPLWLGVALASGILLGRYLASGHADSGLQGYSYGRKMEDIRRFLIGNYVDTLKSDELENLSISALLEKLDPHSAYIPPADFQAAYEDLHGAFDGVGIEFNITSDTIVVVSLIPGGPSELSGIKPGDRIISVNDSLVAGKNITSEEVIRLLRGPRGTKVKVEVVRHGEKPFTVVLRRAKIPIFSVEAALKFDHTGYIKLSRFSDETFSEFFNAFNRLDSQGIKSLVLDLRNNPGGLMDQAVALADFFLPKGSRIVSTRGAHRREVVYKSRNSHGFRDIPLAVLIDRGSASASEIVAGAFQDNDRAVIIGENSFGKGLVQEQVDFPDGSALRITVARYYTPSGRCIQREYEGEDQETYYLKHISGAYDSLPDTTRMRAFTTLKGRKVYEAGGIQPDIRIARKPSEDPMALPPSLFSHLADFAFEKADRFRGAWKEKYPDYRLFFADQQEAQRLLAEFLNRYGSSDNALTAFRQRIMLTLQALISRHVWGSEAFYYRMLQEDPVFNTALRQLKKSDIFTP